MPDAPDSNPERARRLEQVLAEYLHAEAAGQPLDPHDLLAQHPDLADDLGSFLRNRAAMERLAEPLRQQAHPEAVTIGSDSVEGTGVGARVRYVGDYELLEEIARGGMGVVFKARQVSLQRLVALKMILKGELATPADVQRFHAEAKAAANLDHPNIVPIYEVGDHEGQQYFSMKLIDLDRTPGGSTSRQPQHRAASLVASVARAVHHAHQRGILHRDLKPSNILIDRAGEAHVADFGLAKHLDVTPESEGRERATHTGAIVGTPAYMAPEQARAEKDLTTAVDVYSLGAVLYHWLTGRPPFDGRDPIATLLQVTREEPVRPRAVDPTIDADLETICLKCLDKNPDGRYRSAEALADDLDRWQRGEPIEARPVGRGERAWRWCRRNPILAGLTAAVVTLLVAVALGATIAAFRIATARDAAHVAQQRESEQRQLAEQHADDAKKRLARQYVSNAARALEVGDHFGALPWLVAALRQDEGKPEREAMQRLRLGCVLQECPKLTQLWFPPGDVIDLSFVGTRLRAVTADGTRAQVWDVLTGESLSAPLEVGDAPIHSVAFRPDGKQVVLGAGKLDEQNHGLQVWDAVTGKRICALELTPRPCLATRATFTPDGKRILVQRHWPANPYYHGGETGMWDASTGKRLTPLHKLYGVSDDWVGDALGGKSVFSPDGKRVATLSGNAASVWDADKGQKITPADFPREKGKEPPPGAVAALDAAFSPDGTLLAVGFAGYGALQPGAVGVWDIATGKPVAPWVKTHAAVVHLAFSPDAKVLHVMGADSTLWAWDMKQTESFLSLADSPRQIQPASDPRLSTNGIHTLVPLGKHVLVWNMARGQPLTPLLRHEAAVKVAAFDAEGCRVATSGPGLPVRVFDIGGAPPTLPGRAYTNLAQGNTGSAFSADRKQVIATTWPNAAQLWDVEAEKALAPAQYFADGPWQYAPGWNGARPLALQRRDRDNQTEFRLTNMATGKVTRIRVAQRPDAAQPWILLTADCRWAITGGGMQGTQVWDTDTGQTMAVLVTSATNLVCNPDSGSLVGYGAEGRCQAWELPGGRLLWTAPAPSSLSELEFSEDGARLLVVSEERAADQARGRVVIWNAHTGVPLFEPILLARPVRQHRLSPDGTKLFILDEDSTARLFSAASGAPLSPSWKTDLSSMAYFCADGTKVFLTDWTKGQGRLWDSLVGKPAGPPISAWNSWWPSPDGRMVFATFDPALSASRAAPLVIPHTQLRSHLVEAETGLPLTPPLTDVPYNDVVFSPDRKRLRFSMDGIVTQRELLTEERSSAQLERLALVLSRHRIDESESFVFAERPTFQKAWQDHQAQALPRDLAYTPRQRHEWHVQAAVDCASWQVRAWQGAILHLDRVLQQGADSALLYWRRGQAWEHLGDDARALADFNEAVARQPGYRKLWEDRGWLQLRRQEYAAATSDFARVVEFGNADSRSWHHLALLYLRAGKTQEYRNLCDRMLSSLQSEGVPDANDVLWTCTLQPGAVPAARLLAVADLKKVELGPAPRTPIYVYLRTGKSAEAVAYLEWYLKRDEPGPGPLLAWAALVYQQAGRKDEADTWRRRAAHWRDNESATADWAERAECDLLLREFQAAER